MQNFIIKTFLIKVGALRSLFPVSLPGFFLPCLSGIGIHYLSLEMELFEQCTHTCQYKNCTSHIEGGNSLSPRERGLARLIIIKERASETHCPELCTSTLLITVLFLVSGPVSSSDRLPCLPLQIITGHHSLWSPHGVSGNKRTIID